MNCRVPACERLEWMGRQICHPHLKLLPSDLQQRIRRAVNGKFRSDELPALIDEAVGFLAVRAAEQQVTSQIGIFRTHMATVAAIVAGIRTVPMRQLRDQLAASSEALLATNPELHAERKTSIDRDLAFLDFFADARDRLGEIIDAYPLPAPAAAEVAE